MLVNQATTIPDPTTMKTESEANVWDSATLRAVKDLAFDSVSESGSVLVLHSVQIRLREWYQNYRASVRPHKSTVEVLGSQASSTLPSYMMTSPTASPIMVSECSVHVDAVTRCVGRGPRIWF